MPAPVIRLAAGKLWAIPKVTAGTGATFTFPMNDPSACGSKHCIPEPESGSARRNCPQNAKRGNGRRVPVRGAP
jgi:hypothetical protein